MSASMGKPAFKNSGNLNISFMLLVTAIMAGLILPSLVKHGMFMDGLIYAVISMNLSNGEGSFWFPAFTETIYPHFHDHPPLVFGLQSLFFRILGDGYLTERFYSFLTAFLSAVLIVRLWNLPLFGKKQRGIAWFPLLLWITVPVVFWSYANNMLENTMGIFTMISVWLILSSFSAGNKMFILKTFLAGTSILAGMLSKGFPALFPLSVPVIVIFLFQKFSLRKALVTELLLLGGIILPGFLIWLIWPQSAQSISIYLDTQVFSSLKGELVVVNRFHIAGRLFSELIPVFSLTFLLLLLSGARTRKDILMPKAGKTSLFFILTGLTASLPIMISPKQLGFYLVPSMPWFAMGFGFLLLPVIERFLGKIRTVSHFPLVLRLISLMAIMAVTVFTTTGFGGYSRDREKINDIEKISNIEGMRKIISIDPAFYRDWSLIGYFKRNHGINLDRSGNLRHFHLTPKENESIELQGYTELYPGLTKYRIFQKTEKDL